MPTAIPEATGRLPLLVVSVVLVGLLGVYAAQTELGHWQVDEFLYFADHRATGWAAYWNRFYVSPRPLSELLIYGYGAAVLAFDRGFVPVALLLVWGGSLLAMVGAAWATLRAGPGRLLAAGALGIAPMILIMQISPVTEMFFWPVATVAYVPAAASLTALLFLLHDEPGPARQRWCGVALLAATLSHEIGAAFALCFAGVVAGFIVRERRTGRDRIAALWWLIPALAGGLVMAGLVVFRSQYVDLGSDTKPYTGRLLASAVAAGRQLIVEFGTASNWPHDPAGVVAAIVQKAAFAVGFVLIWRRWGWMRPNRWQAAVAAGLVGGAYFALLAAYNHYGDLCCERHASIRQWLIALVYIVAAAAVLGRWERVPAARWGGPLLLVASLAPVIAQVPEIQRGPGDDRDGARGAGEDLGVRPHIRAADGVLCAARRRHHAHPRDVGTGRDLRPGRRLVRAERAVERGRCVLRQARHQRLSGVADAPIVPDRRGVHSRVPAA